MPSISTPSVNDPVSQVVLNASRSRGAVPVPLIATSYDISIHGGLADVTVARTFRNEEATSIEATLTFPVPVHAVLYALEAKISGRTLKAISTAKRAAREKYEDAVDQGKSAVLHEELLKGVHMLSVAHVAPCSEIVVTVRFAIALSYTGGRALLRLPTTAGDIYGDSGLPDSDELTHGGTVHAAALRIAADQGVPVLLGGTLTDGAARVLLDRPINIEVLEWQHHPIIGRAADGGFVTLDIAPSPAGQSPLDIAVLVDRSGSMGEACTAAGGLSKHQAVLLGLSEAGGDLRSGDRLNLWQFDDTADDLGTVSTSDWQAVIRTLQPPGGGTEIGGAIDAVLSQRPARHVLLITDGKSHALDVQQLARRGVRFTVVLIGDDSLEANVGYLASLSGGEIYAPVDAAAVTAAVRSALQSLRAPLSGNERGSGDTILAVRAGMQIRARWHTDADAAAVKPSGRAAAAYAAALKIGRLSESEASALAVAEGLVTHLTSLVLVDEEGVAQSGLPAMRKIDLPEPACASVAARSAFVARSAGPVRMNFCFQPRAVQRMEMLDASPPPKQPVMRSDAPKYLAEGEDDVLIDWKSHGAELADGNMVHLKPSVADLLDEIARDPTVARTAKNLGLTARRLVIGLLAKSDAGNNRYADRVARAILGKIKTGDLADISDHVRVLVMLGRD